MYSASLQAFSPGYFGQPQLETTGKILLPDTALNDIYARDENVPKVILFQIENIRNHIRIHAGVESFTAPRNQICLPYWMMEFLQIEEGSQVRVSTVRLATGTSATFQPKDTSFMKLKDQKVVLEHALRQHPCLTQGTVFPIDFANRRYFLKVLKTEPKQGIFTLNTDLAVEFAPPETEFDHRWLEPDTDSSDDMGDLKVHKGRTLRGKDVSFTEEKKIMHSTFESRERDRMKPGAVEGVRTFVMGQEILPPKPDENTMVAKERKAQRERDMFKGAAHTISRSKSKGGSSDSLADLSKSPSTDVVGNAPIAEQPKEEKKPQFFGTGKTLRGKVTQLPTREEVMAAEEEPEKKKSDFEFQGVGRSLNGRTVEIKHEEEKPADPNLLYGKKEPKPKESEFQGQAHTLKRKK